MTMVSTQPYVEAWWGRPSGRVDDPAFFELTAEEQKAALAPFSWAEFKAPLDNAPAPKKLHDANFFQVDTQVTFRIGLSQIKPTESLDRLSVRFADQHPFTVAAEDFQQFRHERYLNLPGITDAQLRKSYALWSADLIADAPEWCCEILADGVVQGWYLSRMDQKGLWMALAMLHKDTIISGMHLYHKASVEYAARGARVGHASFSTSNTPVLNIYSALDARFTSAKGCWMWLGG
jgi:hypothetical protein